MAGRIKLEHSKRVNLLEKNPGSATAYNIFKAVNSAASKMDRISRLPIGIIETILCLLPIQEAARTSILSREWRYHWTTIPKLTFDERTFQVSTDGAELSVLEKTFDNPSKRKEMSKRDKLFYAICQVLLMHEGPIREFTLSVNVDADCVEIDHIILHLSKKNTLKKLALYFQDVHCEYMLPVSLFSLHQLTELYIEDCEFMREPSFCEFGCLTTLYLEGIWTYDKTLLRLLSSCPSLKRLTLNSRNIFYTLGGPTIVDLFKCIPSVEYLSVLFDTFECFIRERLPKELPTPLAHLKCLRMESLFFTYEYGLPFLLLLIRSSTNLEKLELVLEDLDWSGEDELDTSFTLEDYSDTMSPALKKARIFTLRGFDEDEAAEISKFLLCAPCASPVVKISVEKFRYE